MHNAHQHLTKIKNQFQFTAWETSHQSPVLTAYSELVGVQIGKEAYMCSIDYLRGRGYKCTLVKSWHGRN